MGVSADESKFSSLKVAYSDNIQVVTKSLILKTLQPHLPSFFFFSTLFSFPYLILSFPYSIPHSCFTLSQPSPSIKLVVPPIEFIVPPLAPSRNLSAAVGVDRDAYASPLAIDVDRNA